MAVKREKVVVWWIDYGYGKGPPILRHVEAERTEKMVYFGERGDGPGFASQVAVGDKGLFFTAREAVTHGIARKNGDLGYAQQKVAQLEEQIKTLITIREDLDAGQ